MAVIKSRNVSQLSSDGVISICVVITLCKLLHTLEMKKKQQQRQFEYVVEIVSANKCYLHKWSNLQWC